MGHVKREIYRFVDYCVDNRQEVFIGLQLIYIITSKFNKREKRPRARRFFALGLVNMLPKY